MIMNQKVFQIFIIKFDVNLVAFLFLIEYLLNKVYK